MKKIYISGPISGYTMPERIAAFAKVKNDLEGRGFLCVSPLENGLPGNASTHEHMRRDIELLTGCDAIFMMERWCHSAGCKLELDIAVACGMDVVFEECGTVKFK